MKLDTMLTTAQGDTFAFYGSKYWKLGEAGVEAGETLDNKVEL